MSVFLKRSLLVGLSLLFSLGLGYLALRLTGRLDPPIAGWKAEGHPASDVNQFGFRGNKLETSPDDFVVLLVGDSFVECVSSPIETIPERLLEDSLKKLGLSARVVSLGARGYGQDQQLLALREYFQENRADLVVTWIIPDNDVWNNMFCTHYGGVSPKPTFRLEGNQLVPPAWDWMKPTEPSGLGWAWRNWRELESYDSKWEKWLPQPYQARKDAPDAKTDTSWQERWDSEPGYHLEEFDTDRHHNLLHLEPRSERIAYGVRLTARLLEAIQSLCKQHKADFTILFTARWEAEAYDRPLDDLVWYELNGGYYGYSSVRYWANMTELYGSFPLLTIPCTVKDWKVSETDLHFNQTANAQIMEDLAKKIVEQEKGSAGSDK